MTEPGNYLEQEALADPMEWPDPYAKLIHDWMSYANEEIRGMWMTFTPEQKLALMRCFQSWADAEHWE